jgi:hypothetical protein
VTRLPDATDIDGTAAITTLILSGMLDAATPTFRSEVIAKSLPNARLVVFPDGTHVQIGAVNLCAAQIMAAFVRDPKGALPLECLGELRFPGFVLPGGTIWPPVATPGRRSRRTTPGATVLDRSPETGRTPGDPGDRKKH